MGIHVPLLLMLLLMAAMAPPPSLRFAAAQTNAQPPADSDYPNNVNSAAGFIFLMMLSALLLTCILVACCCVCCCGNPTTRRIPRHRSVSTSASAFFSAPAPSRPFRLFPRGLDPAAISSFPVFNYSQIKHQKLGKGELSCAVCVSEFEDTDRLRLLPQCDHVFHLDCIDPWLASHSTCPICRAQLGRVVGPTRPTEEVQDQIEIAIEVEVEVEVDPRERVRTFPRPHSTGHSLGGLGEDCERYTLRLPDEVRGQVNRLDRAAASDRWFCVTPPFSVSRTGSLRSAKVGVVEGDFVTTAK